MANRLTKLNDDPYVPFRFRRGDRVAWQYDDGSLDPDYRGVIVDGLCEYQEGGGGSYKNVYIVERVDGMRFPAGDVNIVRI